MIQFNLHRLNLKAHDFNSIFVHALIYQGGWELDESLEQAALRESIEEAGVLGNVEVSIFSSFP